MNNLKSKCSLLQFVRFRLMNLCHPLVVVKCYCSSSGGSGHGCTPSHVFWVVLQTGDELFDLFALEADLVDCRKQWKPGRENRYPEWRCFSHRCSDSAHGDVTPTYVRFKKKLYCLPCLLFSWL